MSEKTNHPRLPEGWWIGQRATCSGANGCGAVVELDGRDNPEMYLSPDSEGAFFKCVCGKGLCVFQSRVAPAMKRVTAVEVAHVEPKPEAKPAGLFRGLLKAGGF